MSGQKAFIWSLIPLLNTNQYLEAIKEVFFFGQNKHKRKIMKKCVLCFCIGVIASGLCSAQSSPEQPNVLFIVYDDLGSHLTSYGDPNAKQFDLTPNFDRLADMSLQFNNSYCQAAICGPSRASLLTGLRPNTIGITTQEPMTYSTGSHPLFHEMIRKYPTMLNYFREHGYYTARAGKIHHMYGVAFPWEPTSYEMERDRWPRVVPNEFLRYANTDGGVKPWSGQPSYWQDPEVPVLKERFFPWKDSELRAKTPIYEMHLDYDKDHPWRNRDVLYTEMTLDAIDKAVDKGKPFFVAYGVTAPHDPYVQPKEFADKIDPRKLIMPETWGITKREGRPVPGHYYGSMRSWSDGTGNWVSWDDYLDRTNIPEKPWEGQPLPNDAAEIRHEFIYRKILHSYYASIAFADYLLGRVLDKLEERGLRDNTIIILLSDHGFHVFDHDSWCKTTHFRHSARTVTYISTPGMKTAGQQTESMNEFVDFYPTILDFAGLPPIEGHEGFSLRPILEDPLAKVKPYAFHQFYKSGPQQMGYSIYNQHYRYTAWFDDPDGRGAAPPNGARFGEIEFEELYDFEKDPQETRNIAGDPEYREIQAQLRAELIAHYANTLMLGQSGNQ